jgi:transcriptional regulator with XRE-family HTH domain
MVCAVAALSVILANAIRAERSRRSWRQADLAERCGWSVDVQGAIERGVRVVSIDDIERLCAAFGVPLAALLVGAEPEELRHLGL